jgi:Flp pilus assembly protein TadG
MNLTRFKPVCTAEPVRFARAEDGVAILEFALITPLLLLIYFGTVELATAMRQARKIDLLTRTLGDTFSQRTFPTSAEAADIFQVAPIVMAPLDSTDIKMTVSAVGVVGHAATGTLQICSSAAAPNSPQRVPGAPAPVAAADGTQPMGTRLILVEVSMLYKPVTGSAFFKDGAAGFTMSRKTLWPVRYGRRFWSQSPEIVIANGLPCPLH